VAIIGLYAGLLGLIYLTLSFRVVSLRRKHGIGLGDGGNADLQQVIRAHANFSEYVPICLILLSLLASIPVNLLALHVAGGVLVISRALHALGLTQESGRSFGRYWGTVLTWSLLLILSIANIILFIAF